MTKKEARRRRTSSADGAVTQEIFEVNDEESVGVGAEKEVGGKRKRDKEEEQRVGGDEGEMEVGEDTVSLISSDGQTLVVMAQLLRDESPMFRAMLSLSQFAVKRHPITLTDARIETFEVITSAIKLITTELGIVDVESDSRGRFCLLDFARKWDFIRIVGKFEVCVAKGLKSETANHLHFRASRAMLFGFPKEAARYAERLGHVKHVADQRWAWGTQLREYSSLAPSPAVSQPVCDARSGGVMGDLGNCSFEVFSSLPAAYVWAVLRARAVAESGGKAKNSSTISAEFEKIAASMYPAGGLKR